MKAGKYFALVVTFLLATSGTGQAQDQAVNSVDELEARSLFEAGRVAFADGRFQEALERFERAFELSGRPALLYNIAGSHDRLDHDQEAIAAYERYLAEMPDPGNRSFVESRLEVLRQRASRQAPVVAVTPSVTEQVDAPPLASDARAPSVAAEPRTPILSIVLFGVAGVTGAVGIGFGVHTLSLRDDLEMRCPSDLCTQSEREDVDSLRTAALVADVMLGLSLASAVGGLVTWLLTGDEREENDSLAFTPTATSSALGGTLRGSF